VFAALNGNAVVWNIVLNGNTFTESHSVNKKPFVAEFTAGLSMTVGSFRLSYANVSQTKEFEGQKGYPEIRFDYLPFLVVNRDRRLLSHCLACYPGLNFSCYNVWVRLFLHINKSPHGPIS